MNYQTYLTKIKNELQAKMGDGYSISITNVKKNNGIDFLGICITDKEHNLSPVFYLDDQFKEDKDAGNEMRISETVGDILRLYYDQGKTAQMDLGLLKSYANLRDKVLFRLVNHEKNKEVLSDIPHKLYYDLAMVFYLDIPNKIFESGSILLNNSHLETWGVTAEEVFTDAYRNTPKLLPAVTQSMAEVMREILEFRIYKKYGEDESVKKIVNGYFEDEYGIVSENEMSDGKRSKMYVASNATKTYGAAVFFYPGFIKDFAEKVDADLYIFPSSVHEIIIAPATKEHNRKELIKMVCEVNASKVAPDEVLADTVYYYDRAVDVIEIIN